MNLNKERKSIEAALDDYRSMLETIPDDVFTETPADGGWSYAEVYSHITKATLGASIALERCTHGSCEPTKKGLTLAGWYMMLTGTLLRSKAPAELEAKIPALKISKEEAKNALIKCRKRIDDTFPLIEKSSDSSRINHRKAGMLNAKQWLRFIRIHLYHHLGQIQRIEKKFNAA